jgi:hypothetical protein
VSLSLIGFGVICITPAELSLSYPFPERVKQGGRAVQHKQIRLWEITFGTPKFTGAIEQLDPGIKKPPSFWLRGFFYFLGFDLLLLIPATY